MNIEIRKIDAESAACAAELERLCFSEPWSEKAILEEAERGFFIAAYIDGEFAGYAGMLCVLDERDVCNIATVPHFRGKGVGMALTQALIESARESGASVIMLEVRKSAQTEARTKKPPKKYVEQMKTATDFSEKYLGI